MSKVDTYRALLRKLEDWEPFLLQESGLPGPRGNLELARAVAEEGDEERFWRWLDWDAERAPTNSPYEFLAFCGVLGLGRLLAGGRVGLLQTLARHASDRRWRIREAVAMALQRFGGAKEYEHRHPAGQGSGAFQPGDHAEGATIMKVKLGAVPLLYPIPIVLAGADVGGRANFATLGDCGIMGINPPLVYVSLHQKHYTTQGILENGTFSVNVPSTSLLAVTDYCGMVSGREVDKSALFEIFYGELGTAPLIKECPACLECRVVKEFSIEHRQIFVGEVVQAHVDEAFVVERDGRRSIAAMTQLDPILYALDNRYYRVGKPIGTGYSEGKALQGYG